jgi:hypothetical protein
MTRTQQTAWIVGAIAAVGLILTFVLWPEPNLDGMRDWDKCAYRSYNKNRGGNLDACRSQLASAAAARLMGYPASTTGESPLVVENDMDAVDVNFM